MASSMKTEKLHLVRYGVKVNGIVLLGHSCLPLMVETRKEAKRMWHGEHDKIIKITISEEGT